MTAFFIKTVVFMIITLAFCIPAQAGWIIYHKPAFTVRVIDAHTREPIRNAVVVIMYRKGPIISGPAGGSSQTFKARENITGENGEVHIPSYITLMGPNSHESPFGFIVFKPGYMRGHPRKSTDDNIWVAGLSKANTWKERRATSRLSVPHRVNKQIPILKEILKKEEEWLYQSKNKAWVNYDSRTALISIAKEGRINIAKSLIANGSNVNYSIHVLRTALMEAAREGRSGMVTILLANGADVNLISSQTGRTALMEASREGYLMAVQLLIKAGANVNIKDRNGKTALIEAVEQSVQTAKKESAEVEIIRALIGGGVNINYNQQGETALRIALTRNQSKVIRILINSGIDISLKDTSSGLIFAASSGNMEMAKILIENGADINYRSYGFGMMTPLMYAAKRGHLNFVQMLIDVGADVNARDARSKTARMLAEEAGHSKVATMLKNVEKE